MVLDGSLLHGSRPFSGERFSLVRFTHVAVDRLSAEMRQRVESSGFTLPAVESASGSVKQRRLLDQ